MGIGLDDDTKQILRGFAESLLKSAAAVEAHRVATLELAAEVAKWRHELERQTHMLKDHRG